MQFKLGAAYARVEANPKAVLLLAVAAVLQLSILAWFGLASRLSAPFADEYDWIERTFHPLGATYLWEPHNHQRIVWARLSTLIDVRLFHAETVAGFVAPLAVMVVAAGIAATAFVRTAADRRVGAAGATLAFVAMTEASLVSSIAWPVNSVYVYAAAFASIAIVAFEMAPGSRRKGTLLAAALVAGVLAGFGNAAGLAVWPVLAFGAIRHRRFDAATLAVVLGGFAFCVLWTADLGAPTGDARAVASHGLAHLAKAWLYFLDYLGLPLTGNRAPHTINFVFGGLVLALSALALARRGEADRPDARARPLGQGLILFSLATAALAAVGRVDELPVPVAPIRYGAFLSSLHVGLVFCFAPLLAGVAGRARGLFWTGVGAVLVAALAWQVFAGWWALSYAQTIAAANAAFARGDRSPAVMTWIYPDPSRAERIRGEMQRRGLRPAAGADRPSVPAI